MSKVYLSPLAGRPLISYLTDRGYQPVFTQPLPNLATPIACHPDMILCKLGVCDEAPVFHGDSACLRPRYPGDVCYNACCTGRYFIHNLKYTSPQLLAAAAGMIPVQVSQGYAKCSIVCVDETSLITYDAGIAGACRSAGPEVLQISPDHVLLPGYRTGFIGGCSGRIGSEILFNGDLSAHPDYAAIRSFIESRGLSCVFFDSYPLTDIGSIIFSL